MDVLPDREMTLDRLFVLFDACSAQRESGRLEIRSASSSQSWHLYFELGRLTWTTGGNFPQRRWRRQFLQACRNSDMRAAYPAREVLRTRDRFDAWDYHLLLSLHGRQQIDLSQLQQITAGAFEEVLFDLLQAGSDLFLRLQAGEPPANPFQVNWVGNLRPSQELKIHPSWVPNLPALLQRTRTTWQNWFEAGLAPYSPDLGPRILDLRTLQAQTAPVTYKNLTALLNGDRSFRDLAVMMNCKPIKVARPLLSLYRKNILTFATLQDLPERAPSPAPPPLPERSGRRTTDTTIAPLIACIDDSLQACQVAEAYLAKLGYRSFSISDPIQALAALVAKKPDLVLLDLVMPVVNGYELCAQIRRVSLLSAMPVIVVTGNDGVVDRVRAKLAGASGFISKPFTPQQLKTVLDKHLPTR